MKEINFAAEAIFLRTPYYSFDSFWEKPPSADAFRSSEFLEALYLGSPDLYHAFVRGLTDTEMDKEVTRSIYKYYLRMSYRCTPFGIFSGVSLGKADIRTKILICGKENYKKHTRLDSNFLGSFIDQLHSIEDVRFSLRWFTNNTAYRTGASWRFVNYLLRKGQRSYHLSSVEHSDYLQQILKKAEKGATIAELIHVIESNEITKDEALSFINELIESNLIVSELEQGVTGEVPIRVLLELLQKHTITLPHAVHLRFLCDKIEIIDSQPPGTQVDIYQDVVREIRMRNGTYAEKMIFQSDLIKPVQVFFLNTCVMEELKTGISFLSNFCATNERLHLRKFKEEFHKRYEDLEVPLLEVLDPESGLGYPVGWFGRDNTPILDNIIYKGKNVDVSNTQPEVAKSLLERYKSCVERNELEIVLTEKDAPEASNENVIMSEMPDTFATMCSVLAASCEEIDKGNYEIIHNVTHGPSAVSLVGRFCHADSEIHKAVKMLIDAEEKQDPNKIYAEIVHLAQARIGNVLIRPTLRKHEIPIVTFPSVDQSHSIPLADLMVSIRNNRIVLRSKRLDKEIIPRNTTAHNFANDSLPYYHFLSELQFQDSRNTIHWQWGILDELSFLPRVRFGKIIFSKARWIVDLAKLDLPKNFKEEEFATRFQTYAIANRIPEKVVLTQADNQLPLHLGHPMCLKILMQELKRNKRITLEECLFTDDNLFVTGPEGKFTNEFIIPWTMVKKNANTPHPHVRINDVPSVRRSFTPGSSWHYVKIYCGVKTADKLLTEVIKPLVEELLSAGVIHKWFFIRYADPDHHLRIRFSGGAQFYSVVTDKLNELLQPYLESNLVWKIQTDTYQRELERYGPENIENSESLFFHDSVASIQILSLLEGDEGDDLRWQFAFKGVNDLLNSFGLDLPAKRELLSALSTGFLKEFDAGGSESKKQLGAKYRGIKDKIQIALQPSLPPDHEFVEVWEILSARSKNLETPISAINSLEEQGKLSVSKSNLMGSYIHMFLNRFLRSKQRLQEMVIYDLLHRHYRSLIARETKSALVL